jgi:DNA-binding MarR family transcriptional regulator
MADNPIPDFVLMNRALNKLAPVNEMTARALAAHLLVKTPEISRTMRKLARAGLVEGVAGHPDRGGLITRWRITQAGRSAMVQERDEANE